MTVAERLADAAEAFASFLRRHGFHAAIPEDLLHRAVGVAVEAHAAPDVDDPVFVFRYRNDRGRPQEKHVLPVGVRYDVTDFHPDGAWLLFALDQDRNGEVREFDLGEFGSRYLAGASGPQGGWSRATTAPDDGTFILARYRSRRPFVAWWGDPHKTGREGWTDGYERREFDEWRYLPVDP